MSREITTKREHRKRINVLYKNASKEGIMPSKPPLINQNPCPSQKPMPETSSIAVSHSHLQTARSKPSSCRSSPNLTQELREPWMSTVQCQRSFPDPNSSQIRTTVPDQCQKTMEIPIVYSKRKTPSSSNQEWQPQLWSPDQCQKTVAKPVVYLKRNTPSSSNQEWQPQFRDQPWGANKKHTIQNQNGNLFCELCKVPCLSTFNMKQHLEGAKHKAKLQQTNPIMGSRGETRNKQWKCDLCEIWCQNEDLFKLHVKGKKHKTNLELPDPENCRAIGNKKWECELCEIWCMSEDLYKLHLQGKKHINSLHKYGIKKKPKPGNIGFC